MKVLASAALLCTIAVSCGVVTSSAYEGEAKDAYDIMNILMRRRTPERYMPTSHFQKYGIEPATGPAAFSFQNCGDPMKETVKLVSLEITPNPVELPGRFGVAFDVDVLKEVGSPLQASVQIKKKDLSNWISVPCTNELGTCNYDDLCEILALIPKCPLPFIHMGYPCKCPFPVGNYTLPMTEFQVESSIPLSPADYFIQVRMMTSGQLVACFSVTISII